MIDMDYLISQAASSTDPPITDLTSLDWLKYAAIGPNAREVPRPMSSLSTLEPLIQCRLPSSGHHLPYVLFLHHTSIAHEFFHRSCGNWGHADEDLSSD
jgi:hypothetical protein